MARPWRAAVKETAKAAKLEAFVTKNSASASKAKAAQSRQKQLDAMQGRLEEVLADAGGGKDLGNGPGDSKRVALTLPVPPAGRGSLVRCPY